MINDSLMVLFKGNEEVANGLEKLIAAYDKGNQDSYEYTDPNGTYSARFWINNDGLITYSFDNATGENWRESLTLEDAVDTVNELLGRESKQNESTNNKTNIEDTIKGMSSEQKDELIKKMFDINASKDATIEMLISQSIKQQELLSRVVEEFQKEREYKPENKSTFVSLFEKAKDCAYKVKETFDKSKNFIKNFANETYDKTKGLVEKSYNYFSNTSKEKISQAYDTASGIAKGVTDAAKEKATKVLDEVKENVQILNEAAHELGHSLDVARKRAIQKIKEPFESVADKIKFADIKRRVNNIENSSEINDYGFDIKKFYNTENGTPYYEFSVTDEKGNKTIVAELQKESFSDSEMTLIDSGKATRGQNMDIFFAHSGEIMKTEQYKKEFAAQGLESGNAVDIVEAKSNLIRLSKAYDVVYSLTEAYSDEKIKVRGIEEKQNNIRLNFNDSFMKDMADVNNRIKIGNVSYTIENNSIVAYKERTFAGVTVGSFIGEMTFDEIKEFANLDPNGYSAVRMTAKNAPLLNCLSDPEAIRQLKNVALNNNENLVEMATEWSPTGRDGASNLERIASIVSSNDLQKPVTANLEDIQKGWKCEITGDELIIRKGFLNQPVDRINLEELKNFAETDSKSEMHQFYNEHKEFIDAMNKESGGENISKLTEKLATSVTDQISKNNPNIEKRYQINREDRN